ncbi:heterodisulfide reductase-related iron-sulfur binding cluster [bacterium]
MKIPYFPGCTLFEKAKKFNQEAIDIASLFGYKLSEIPDWTCCGAVFPNSIKDIMKFAGPYRMLASAEKESDKLLTLCSACYNVMKRANKVIKENEDIREKLKLFTEVEYNGNVNVIHYLEFLKDIVTYEKIKEAVKTKNKIKVSPYYGCLILRPYEELGLDDPENPKLISNIIELIGDELVKFPSQNECCGAYLSVTEDAKNIDLAKKICFEAREYGSDFLVTSCPLCSFALNKAEDNISIKYFTEYLAESLEF